MSLNRNELHDEVLEALTERREWDDRQLLYYNIRHNGIRRTNPPYSGAPDTHPKLCDGAIEKFKPFFFGQLYGDKRVADFCARRNDLVPFMDSAASLFDYKVKNQTNADWSFMSAVDTMLMRGRGIVKVWYDVVKKKICVDVIDPIYFVVPSNGRGPEHDDWFVEIKSLTIHQFKGESRYDARFKTKEFIKKLQGGEKDDETGSTAEQDKYDREGITMTRDKRKIIIWVRWEKTASGWWVNEYSPKMPDVILRGYGCPYLWRGEAWQPYVDLVSEVKGDGWYEPRGLCERLGGFEMIMKRMQDAKLTMMDFYNVPMFGGDYEQNNVNNFAFKPGQLLPKGVEPMQMPSPPMSFDQEIYLQKGMSEQYIGTPEAGLVTDTPQGGEKPTARQVDYHASIQAAMTNLRGWVFRKRVAEVYKRIWSLIVQYQRDDLVYWVEQDNKTLPVEALSDMYDIQPAGAIDGWNRQARIQDAFAFFQVFKGDPKINQDGLYKRTLAEKDGRLVNELLMPDGMEAAKEQNAALHDIAAMDSGGIPKVLPHEDHAVRVQVAVGALMHKAQTGGMVDPMFQQRVLGYIATHVQMLTELNPKAGKQLAQGLAQLEQQMGMQPNVTPMPQGTPQMQGVQ